MQEKEAPVRVRVHRPTEAAYNFSLPETLANFHSDVLWQQKILRTAAELQASAQVEDHQETSGHIETDAPPPYGNWTSVSMQKRK